MFPVFSVPSYKQIIAISRVHGKGKIWQTGQEAYLGKYMYVHEREIEEKKKKLLISSTYINST